MKLVIRGHKKEENDKKYDENTALKEWKSSSEVLTLKESEVKSWNWSFRQKACKLKGTDH